MSDRDSSQFDSTTFDNGDFDGDDRLRALLRGGDPAGSLPPADPAALRSLVEDIMSADLEIRPADQGLAEPARRTRTTWLVAAAAVAAIAAGGAFAVTGLTGNGSNAPQADHPANTAPESGAGVAGQTTQLRAGAPQDKCAVLTPALLAQYDQAFQGTVTSVEGNTITFHTTEVYSGQVGETVQLAAPPAGVARILGRATTFQVGQSYLVPAYQGAVSMCGYTGVATGDLKTLFQKAFVH
jgi:hypothetical protein